MLSSVALKIDFFISKFSLIKFYLYGICIKISLRKEKYPVICLLRAQSDNWAVELLGCRTSGYDMFDNSDTRHISNKCSIGQMGCRTNGLSDKWGVPDYFRDCSLIIVDYQITFKITQILQIILRLLLNFTDCLMRLRDYFEDYWDYGKITGILLRLCSRCTRFFQVVYPSLLA